MNKLHCPECQSVNVKPIAIGKGPTTFANCNEKRQSYWRITVRKFNSLHRLWIHLA